MDDGVTVSGHGIAASGKELVAIGAVERERGALIGGKGGQGDGAGDREYEGTAQHDSLSPWVTLTDHTGRI
jgi:hypothetical protein